MFSHADRAFGKHESLRTITIEVVQLNHIVEPAVGLEAVVDFVLLKGPPITCKPVITDVFQIVHCLVIARDDEAS